MLSGEEARGGCGDGESGGGVTAVAATVEAIASRTRATIAGSVPGAMSQSAMRVTTSSAEALAGAVVEVAMGVAGVTVTIGGSGCGAKGCASYCRRDRR